MFIGIIALKLSEEIQTNQKSTYTYVVVQGYLVQTVGDIVDKCSLQ